MPWACQICTIENIDARTMCEMCGSDRPSYVPPDPSTSAEAETPEVVTSPSVPTSGQSENTSDTGDNKATISSDSNSQSTDGTNNDNDNNISNNTDICAQNLSPQDMQAMLAAMANLFTNSKHKMVLVVRMDLKMRSGKIAAQCAHAAVAIFQKLSAENPAGLSPWLEQGQMKVVLKAKNLEELKSLQSCADSLGLPTYQIHDAGRTQVAAGSATVLAIGPGPIPLVDQVTGGLKLL